MNGTLLYTQCMQVSGTSCPVELKEPEHGLKRLHDLDGDTAPAYAATVWIFCDVSVPDIGTYSRYVTSGMNDGSVLGDFREVTGGCCESILIGTSRRLWRPIHKFITLT